MNEATKVRLFEEGRYRVRSVPGVPHGGWDKYAWISFIDQHGEWMP